MKKSILFVFAALMSASLFAQTPKTAPAKAKAEPTKTTVSKKDTVKVTKPAPAKAKTTAKDTVKVKPAVAPSKK